MGHSFDQPQNTWQPSAHSGHSSVRAYALEYYSPEWPKTLAGCLDYTDLNDNEPKAKGENGSSQPFSL